MNSTGHHLQMTQRWEPSTGPAVVTLHLAVLLAEATVVRAQAADTAEDRRVVDMEVTADETSRYGLTKDVGYQKPQRSGMSDIISGTLQVNSKVVLNSERGAIEVIVFPLQAAVGWEMMVARSVEALRAFHNKTVTLEGTLQGQLLTSARLQETTQLRDGTYRGRLESPTGTAINFDLRMEAATQVVSSDFFKNGNYLGSMRARMREIGSTLVATDPRFVFDSTEESAIGGRLELAQRGGGVLHVACVIPEAMPTLYEGDVVFDSPYFRVINIEVDKLQGAPWPPEYATGDIPKDHQPAELGDLSISLTSLFQKAGFDARVHHNDASLGSEMGTLAGRPGEEDRWDEREMHEMMDTNYSRNLNEREWWLYLLIVTRFDGGPAMDPQRNFITDDQGRIVNDGRGTTGIIFDSSTGKIRDPWSPFAEWFGRNNPQHRHLFDFGSSGGFVNSRARQGVAVFWREMLDFVAQPDDWYQSRQLLRTVVHELGHALNLAHTWLVGRADTTSFMNYPQNYPHGATSAARVRNYWNRFVYSFDLEELFHLRHGFYNEVIPGGKNEFMQWTSSSIFRDPTAGGTRSNLSMELVPTKRQFQFTEPVTLELALSNHTNEPMPVGRLSPAYGDVDFVIRKPNGVVQRYQPPLFKCEATPSVLAGGESKKHVTSLAVGADGFTFDTPGRYEITAVVPDASSGVMIVAEPVDIWIHYPEKIDEQIAHRVFTSDAALFLYMGGGEHLTKAKGALNEVAERYPDHPFAAHANLVLGLNALAGQKSAVARTVTTSKPDEARAYLERALRSEVFSPAATERLKATIDLTMDGGDNRRSER
ncbi:MAG TPA: hypothetical protein VJU84_03840 [Pyrinomonadaceae bacterium]|nr:hypothetical protein [Pyrinomonadaceae bacterium]